MIGHDYVWRDFMLFKLFKNESALEVFFIVYQWTFSKTCHVFSQIKTVIFFLRKK